jgi:hypothetical protein
MRYGRLKAGVGPDGVPPEVGASPSTGFGDADVKLGEGDGALVIRGGSMEECEACPLEDMTGSGNGGISSPFVERSTVMCLVGTAA